MTQSAGGKEASIPRFLHLDLQDPKSVKATASHFVEQETQLDILINNPPVYVRSDAALTANLKLTIPLRSWPYSNKLTADGFETQWQVNYLAPSPLYDGSNAAHALDSRVPRFKGPSARRPSLQRCGSLCPKAFAAERTST